MILLRRDVPGTTAAPATSARRHPGMHFRPWIRSRRWTRAVRRGWSLIVTIAGYTLTTGCTTGPPADVTWATGTQWQHAVVVNAALRDGAAGQVHVYIEGDGAPYRRRHEVAADPTPRRALAFELFRDDAQPALYLGRPCHYTRGADGGCLPAVWTTGRYSEDVVSSLHAALLATGIGDRPSVLIGYSGGGVLAELLARRLLATTSSGRTDRPLTLRLAGLVTVAANLDVAAWVRHHDYEPLTGSLDPALLPPLPPSLFVLHVVGAQDTNVPPRLNAGYFARAPTARVWTFATDHACCWRHLWPQVLAVVSAPASWHPGDGAARAIGERGRAAMPLNAAGSDAGDSTAE